MYGDDQFGGDQFGGVAAAGFGGGDQFGGAAFGGGNQFNASQFEGGGFMQNNMQVDNSTPDGKARGDKNRQSLIPVTIKQLKNAPSNASGEQGFTLDGRDLNQVTIVGLIISTDEQSTSLMYNVDDGTDQIMVKMWIDQEQDDSFAERRAQWKEGALVRVIGQMRVFNSTKSIVAYSIQPITDFNEYTFHFLEVVHTHMRFTKGPPPAAQPSGYGGAALGGAAGASYGAPMVGAYGAPATPGGAMYAAPSNSAGSLEALVLSFFQTKGEEKEQGCTVADVAGALQNNGANPEQVRGLVEQLVNDGHLYSTIDDEHFKATS